MQPKRNFQSLFYQGTSGDGHFFILPELQSLVSQHLGKYLVFVLQSQIKWTFSKGSILNTIAVFVSFLNNGLQFLTHLLNLAYLYSVSKQIFKLHYDTMGGKLSQSIC